MFAFLGLLKLISPKKNWSLGPPELATSDIHAHDDAKVAYWSWLLVGNSTSIRTCVRSAQAIADPCVPLPWKSTTIHALTATPTESPHQICVLVFVVGNYDGPAMI